MLDRSSYTTDKGINAMERRCDVFNYCRTVLNKPTELPTLRSPEHPGLITIYEIGAETLKILHSLSALHCSYVIYEYYLYFGDEMV